MVYTLVGATGAKDLEDEWAKLFVEVVLSIGTLGPAKM